MLEKVQSNAKPQYVVFSNINRYQTGSGLCYCYNARMKHTKSGKPFVTLYLRDINGATVPGYVFDLKSPLHAGGEAAKVINKVVKIDWQENYLQGIGLTLILNGVYVVEDISIEEQSKFRGIILDIEQKADELKKFFYDTLKIGVDIPLHIKNTSALDYSQGKVGGLLEHYWRMYKMLTSLQGLSELEFKRLCSMFVVYILTHSVYTRAAEEESADIHLFRSLSDKVSLFAQQLNLGEEVFELVQIFYDYEPKDIYVRTVVHISETVKRIDKEFALYHTIPLKQEGDAGYGKIQRYCIEEEQAR